jgi:hypothetical protein
LWVFLLPSSSLLPTLHLPDVLMRAATIAESEWPQDLRWSGVPARGGGGDGDDDDDDGGGGGDDDDDDNDNDNDNDDVNVTVNDNASIAIVIIATATATIDHSRTHHSSQLCRREHRIKLHSRRQIPEQTVTQKHWEKVANCYTKTLGEGWNVRRLHQWYSLAAHNHKRYRCLRRHGCWQRCHN